MDRAPRAEAKSAGEVLLGAGPSDIDISAKDDTISTSWTILATLGYDLELRRAVTTLDFDAVREAGSDPDDIQRKLDSRPR